MLSFSRQVTCWQRHVALDVSAGYWKTAPVLRVLVENNSLLLTSSDSRFSDMRHSGCNVHRRLFPLFIFCCLGSCSLSSMRALSRGPQQPPGFTAALFCHWGVRIYGAEPIITLCPLSVTYLFLRSARSGVFGVECCAILPGGNAVSSALPLLRAGSRLLGCNVEL